MSVYALGTKLFPGHVGGPYDPLRGNQLAEPIGYTNALGLLTALAILLALGFAAHGAHLATRALAGVALVVLLPTLYFSSSRGALVALAGGAVAQAVLDPARVRLLVWGLVVSVPAALGVLEASRSHALTADGATLQTAQAEGAHLTRVLVVLALAAAAAPVVLRLVQPRLRLPQRSGPILVSAVVAAAGDRRGRCAHRSRRAGHRGRTRLLMPSPSRPRPGRLATSSRLLCSRGADEATTGTSPGRWLATNRCSARAPAASRRTGCRSAPPTSRPRPRCAQPLPRDPCRARSDRVGATPRHARAPAHGAFGGARSHTRPGGRRGIRRLPPPRGVSTGTGRCPS